MWATFFLHFSTLIVLAIIIYNSYPKDTAIGRREMLDLFYICLFNTLWTLVIDSGVVPAATKSYAWFVAVQLGVVGGICMQLLLAGLLGFNLWEDGLVFSVWGIRLTSFLWGVGNFITAILTFKSWGGLSPTDTTALMTVTYTVNAVLVLFFIISQLYISIALLREWWAAGAILLGTFFFAAGQALMYGFGYQICDHVKHYVDGIFFATACNMFAILLVYKAWDILTTEDDEMGVLVNEGGWDLKSAVPDGSLDMQSEYALSNYTLQTPFN